MKKRFFPYLAVVICLLSEPVFSQTDGDTSALGMAGDNLDLYAVMDLFQKAKTIEDFEKSLNEQKTSVNNLDLDLDKKVDFIKVITKESKADSSFAFVLQVAVNKTENQDVAVILVDKNQGKVSLQIVGDEDLYGKNYVIEPKTSTPPVTSNPAYVGPEPVKVNLPAVPIVVVETVPIVQYVYSPLYVPYVPPYYYGFYPPYFAAFSVMAVGIYRANHYYHHGGYHGGHYGGNNNVVINNNNNFNNYNNNSRNRATTVSDNKARGNYGDGAGASNRANNSNRASASTRPSSGTSNRPNAGGASGANRPSTGGPSGSNRPTSSTRPSSGTSNRGSGGSYNSPSTSNRSSSSMGSSGRTRSSGSYGGGGGGGMRGGGGGGGRRR